MNYGRYKQSESYLVSGQHYHCYGTRNNYWRGQEKPKGSGTQHSRQSESEWREWRRGSVVPVHDIIDYYGNGVTRGHGHGDLAVRVQEHLGRLGKVYNGARLWKKYQGTVFEGRVRSVVWNRFFGYRAKVIYSDGFVERMTFS